MSPVPDLYSVDTGPREDVPPIQRPPIPYPQREPSFLETSGALLAESPMGILAGKFSEIHAERDSLVEPYVDAQRRFNTPIKGFDPKTTVDPVLYSRYREKYLGAQNPDQAAAISARLVQKAEREDTLERSSTRTFIAAAVSAAALDPLTWMGVGWTRGAGAALGLSSRFGRTVTDYTTAGLAGGAASEVPRILLNPDYSGEDLVRNVAFSGIAGSVIGAFAHGGAKLLDIVDAKTTSLWLQRAGELPEAQYLDGLHGDSDTARRVNTLAREAAALQDHAMGGTGGAALVDPLRGQVPDSVITAASKRFDDAVTSLANETPEARSVSLKEQFGTADRDVATTAMIHTAVFDALRNRTTFASKLFGALPDLLNVHQQMLESPNPVIARAASLLAPSPARFIGATAGFITPSDLQTRISLRLHEFWSVAAGGYAEDHAAYIARLRGQTELTGAQDVGRKLGISLHEGAMTESQFREAVTRHIVLGDEVAGPQIPEIARSAERTRDWLSKTVDYLAAGGVITADTAEAWKANPAYIMTRYSGRLKIDQGMQANLARTLVQHFQRKQAAATTRAGAFLEQEAILKSRIAELNTRVEAVARMHLEPGEAVLKDATDALRQHIAELSDDDLEAAGAALGVKPPKKPANFATREEKLRKAYTAAYRKVVNAHIETFLSAEGLLLDRMVDDTLSVVEDVFAKLSDSEAAEELLTPRLGREATAAGFSGEEFQMVLKSADKLGRQKADAAMARALKGRKPRKPGDPADAFYTEVRNAITKAYRTGYKQELQAQFRAAAGTDLQALKQAHQDMRALADQNASDMHFAGKDFDALYAEARLMVNNLRDLPGGRLPPPGTIANSGRYAGVDAPRGAPRPEFMRAIRLDLPMEDKLPFLELDPHDWLYAYTKQAARSVEWKRFAQDMGISAPMQGRSEFDELRTMIDAQQHRYEPGSAQQARDHARLITLRDHILGMDPANVNGDIALGASRYTSAALVYGMTTMLRGVIGTLSDIGTMALTHGWGKTISEGYAHILPAFSPSSINRKEARSIAASLDTYVILHHGELNAAHEVGDGLWAKTLDGVQKMGSKFMYLSMIQTFTVGAREVARLVTQGRVLEYAASVAAASHAAGRRLSHEEIAVIIGARNATWLNHLGLTPHLSDIHMLNMAHGADAPTGVRLSGFADWPDRAAKEAFREGLAKQISIDVPLPGVEVPLEFRQNALSRVLTQFMSYDIAATNRLLLKGAEEDMLLYTARALPLVMFGAGVWALSELENGRDPRSAPPATIVSRAIAQSGVTGLLAAPLAVLGDAAQSLAGVTGDQGRSISGAVRVPLSKPVQAAMGLVRDTFEAATGQRDWDAGMFKNVLPLIPGNNVSGFGFLNPGNPHSIWSLNK